jgi:hypothetical protein
MLHEAMTLRDIDLLEEELVIEHARRMKAERLITQIAYAEVATAPTLRRLALEYLEVA